MEKIRLFYFIGNFVSIERNTPWDLPAAERKTMQAEEPAWREPFGKRRSLQNRLPGGTAGRELSGAGRFR